MPAIFNAQGEQFSLFNSTTTTSSAIIVETSSDLPDMQIPQLALVTDPVFALYYTDGSNGWNPSVYQQVIFPASVLPTAVLPNTLAFLLSDFSFYYTLDGETWIAVPINQTIEEMQTQIDVLTSQVALINEALINLDADLQGIITSQNETLNTPNQGGGG